MKLLQSVILNTYFLLFLVNIILSVQSMKQFQYSYKLHKTESIAILNQTYSVALIRETMEPA